MSNRWAIHQTAASRILVMMTTGGSFEFHVIAGAADRHYYLLSLHMPNPMDRAESAPATPPPAAKDLFRGEPLFQGKVLSLKGLLPGPPLLPGSGFSKEMMIPDLNTFGWSLLGQSSVYVQGE